MPEVEIKQRYDPVTRKWVSWFVAPLHPLNKQAIKCDKCGQPIRKGHRVWLNFDNGLRYCELDKEEARTDFVQVVADAK